MERKLKVIEKVLDQRKNAFEYINIVIVDANGNKLLNISEGGQELTRHDLKGCNDMMKRASADKESGKETVKEEVHELSDIISKDVEKHNDTSNREFILTEEDLTEISLLLARSRGERFTTNLKNSNYFCLTDCSGMLVCRGNFNIAQKYTQADTSFGKEEECLQEITNNDLFAKKAPLLVADKVSDTMTAVIGETKSDCSMVDIVKEIRNALI